MNKVFLQGIVIILLWVGAWGIIDMIIDKIAQNNLRVRFAAYTVLLLLGFLLICIVEFFVE